MRALLTRISKPLGAGLAAAVLFSLTAAPASAQDDPNPGNITLTAGYDIPSVYFFRGYRQEADPKFSSFAYGDVGLSVFSGDGGLKSAGINFGVWNALLTGSSGSDGPGGIHYEEDFYASFTLGFDKGIAVTPTFTAYTSPNSAFNTVKELSIKVGQGSKYAPYGLVAFELSGQADGGSNKGTYAEFGVSPSWALGSAGSVAVPVKVGLSLNDYYEGADGDEKFGYVQGGVLFTFPMTGVPANFGAWNFHGGVDVLGLGNTTKGANSGDKGQVIGSVGVGLSY